MISSRSVMGSGSREGHAGMNRYAMDSHLHVIAMVVILTLSVVRVYFKSIQTVPIQTHKARHQHHGECLATTCVSI